VIIPRFHKLLNITDPTTLPMVDPKVELADSKVCTLLATLANSVCRLRKCELTLRV
jgi:hypothetical protein